MPKSSVKSGHKAILDSVLLDMPGVKEGKMFGYSAYYVNGKLFACIYGKGVGLKVPEEVAAKLLSEKHIVSFRPLGKPKMKYPRPACLYFLALTSGTVASLLVGV